MQEIYLASSALIREGYDGLKTIDEARKAGFNGVQLFPDTKYRDPFYLDRVIESLRESGLGLIVHLPNVVGEDDLRVVERLVAEFPNSKILIHYLPATGLPDVKGTVVGWKNSKVGPLDDDMQNHINDVCRRVEKDGTFFVFDMGRLLYVEDEGDTQAIQRTKAYIREQMRMLDPKTDVIHLADKSSWVLRFRDCMCVLGDGVMKDFIEDVRAFEGIIVFEHENLQMALDSLVVLKG